ncbi:MAG TPA: hypothetical protein VMH80_00445 [Bryobacteraceae bacterium]|nr:hypothetical protein [Bryobacteraceae bacterium]
MEVLGRMLLRRLFYAFPAGWPGIALLLLRAVLGLVIVMEGRFYIGGPNATPGSWFMGVSAFLAGALFLVGFLTPIITAVVTIGLLSASMALLPTCMPNLFDSRITIVFGLTILVAILGLGPGAFSVDARLFGRREIIIPPPISSSRRGDPI